MALSPSEISEIAAAVAEQLKSEMGMLSAEPVLAKRKGPPPPADLPPAPEEGEEEAMAAMAEEMPEEEDEEMPMRKKMRGMHGA